MDNPTLPESLELIKYAFAQQEELTQILFQTETLIDLVVSKDLATYPLSKIHDCHLVLSGLIQKARGLSEMLMSVIGKVASLLPPKETLH